MTRLARRARPLIAGAALLGAAALAAGCGASGGTSAPGGSSASAAASAATTAGPAASASAAAGAGCATSALTVTVDTSQGGAAAGSTYYPIDFTNTSGAPCTLYGFPGVSFVTGRGGGQIGAPATRSLQVKPATVTLAPGATAHATLQVAEAQNFPASACKPVTAHVLRVYPPGQVTPAYADFTSLTCSAVVPSGDGNPMSINAIEPGAGKSGQV